MSTQIENPANQGCDVMRTAEYGRPRCERTCGHLVGEGGRTLDTGVSPYNGLAMPFRDCPTFRIQQLTCAFDMPHVQQTSLVVRPNHHPYCHPFSSPGGFFLRATVAAFDAFGCDFLLSSLGRQATLRPKAPRVSQSLCRGSAVANSPRASPVVPWPSCSEPRLRPLMPWSAISFCRPDPQRRAPLQ